MSGRTVRRFVEGLLRGQRTARARPDDLEAGQMKIAIELRAARLGSDSPREEFVTDLHRRLAGQMAGASAAHVHCPTDSGGDPQAGRRSVPAVAAASAAAGARGRPHPAPVETCCAPPPTPPAQGALGTQRRSLGARSAPAPICHHRRDALAFDLGTGHRVRASRSDAQLAGGLRRSAPTRAASLWLDAPEGRLRCPCHTTSFSLAGRTGRPTSCPPRRRRCLGCRFARSTVSSRFSRQRNLRRCNPRAYLMMCEQTWSGSASARSS